MKHILLLALSLLMLGIQAQTILFTEDFETNPTSFTLNTTELNSTASGTNLWIINDDYAGGSADLICIGLTIPYSVNSTAGQPGGISNQNGHYLHTISNEALNDGILCSSFQAADGLCAFAENNFSRMNIDISTVGFTNVALDFWWLCNGGPSIFGEVYYSTDAGVSWNLIAGQYQNQVGWASESISMPDFDGQATLRFGFRFVNGVSASASDPGFGLDDVIISGTTGIPNTLSTDNVSSLILCAGDPIDVEYTAAGNYNAPNIFSAELSDANGNFAAPVTIGTLATTVSGTINAMVPPGTVAGTAYRIRVIASDPILTGTTNLNDITVETAPNAGTDTSIVLCKATGFYDLFTFIPGGPQPGGTWLDPGGSAHTGAFSTFTDPAGIYIYTVTGAGNCPLATSSITVQLVNPPNAGNAGNGEVCENGGQVQMINLLTGSPDLSGTWFAPNGLIVNGIYDPLQDPIGVYIYVVDGTAPCENDSTFLNISVIPAPNAGTGGTLQVCNTDAVYDLFQELGGAPDTGGIWTDPSNNIINGMMDPSVASSGLYTYTVSGANCPNATASIAVIIDNCIGISEVGALYNLFIGPIPATDRLYIETEGEVVWNEVMVLDAAGKTLMAQQIKNGSNNARIVIDVPFPNGNYFLVLSAENERVVRKFVIAR